MQPGVYVMTASAKGPGSDDDGSLATQWFIVSDMGLTAFSGNDGIHVFVNSLASTEAVGKAEVRLVARNNEILATRKTDEAGHVLFEAGLARGEGGLSPALLTVTSEKADYAFLSLKTNAFDLTDRGVAGRAVPAGADAFVYAERGVYRSNETVYLTALLRDGQGNAMSGGPLTLVIERPDGVEFRRAVLPDQGAGGRSMTVPLNSAVPTGTWRVRAFTDPKGSSVGETTFMVEDYIPERIEFDVSAKEKVIKAEVPVELKVDGHFLYGAPASGLQLEGDMLVAPAASGRPGYPGYQFGVADEETASNERTPIENLPEADANGVANFPVSLAKPPTSTRPQEAQIFIRMAEAGGRAVERKLVLPVAPAGSLIGIKPLFGDKSVAEGDKAEFDVVFVAPDGKQLPRDGLRYELLKMESRYQWYRQNSSWEYEPVKSTTRVADGDLTLTADKAARVSLAPQPGRYRLDVKSIEADGPVTSVQFDVGWYSDGSADTPDLLEASIDKPEYASGDTMVVSVNARSAGKLTINVLGDRLLTTQTVDVKEGTQQVKLPVGKDWGTGAYVLATLRRPLDAAALRMPGRAIGLKWFGIDKKTRTLQVNLSPPPLVRPGTSAEDSGQARRAQSRRRRQDRRRRGRCRHSQSDQLQAAGAGRLLSRPAPPDGRNPRPLWAVDRRHAGHARPAQDRRRFGRRRAAGLPAHTETARAVFRHRHGRPRRDRRDQLRHSGVRRHRAGDGGGVEFDQARPRHDRRHRARSRGADGDLAALPAQRRPRHHEL